MRYLLSVDDGKLFASARSRRDFFRVSDDTLWAHESHDWLIEAGTGKLLAHRTGDIYYGVESGERLYREVTEYTERSLGSSESVQRPRPRVDGRRNRGAASRAAEQWRLDAACREHPTEWWFGTSRDGARARAVCRGCAVRAECLEYALSQPALPGIWAATSSGERTTIRLARRTSAPVMSPELSSETVAAVRSRPVG